jgi:virulence factor
MASGRKVRVFMIGAGAMANSVHYPSLASFNDVEIAGICDLDPQRLAQTADRFGIPPDRRFEARGPDDYQEMLRRARFDGVYVLGQPHLMFDIWVWCLQRGYNLYIEKPMGLTLYQAEVLAHLADRHGCITQVSHQRRSAPLLLHLREKCLERGPITHAVCEFYKSSLEPMLGARDHMMDDCTHSIDTLRWICGGEVAKVESHCKRIGVPDINWIGAALHFDNGSSGYLLNSWSSGRRVFRVQMHAPCIYCDAEVEGKARLYADGDYQGVEYDTREVAGSEELYVFGGFRNKNREFIDSLKKGREVTSSPFRDCLKTMIVAETILAQALLDRG